MRVPQTKTVRELREMLFEHGLVSDRWMLNYIKKHEARTILEKEKKVNSRMVVVLRERQRKHLDGAAAARKRRADMFGIEDLTRPEMVAKLVSENPDLKFLGLRRFDEPFVSATGFKRGKIARVFVNDAGTEMLFTKAEAEMLEEHGIKVPSKAYDTSSEAPKTMRDMFG